MTLIRSQLPPKSFVDRIEQASSLVAKVVPSPVRKVAYAIAAPIYMGTAFGAVGATVGGTVGALGGPLGLVVVGMTGFVMGATVGAKLGGAMALANFSHND